MEDINWDLAPEDIIDEALGFVCPDIVHEGLED